MHPYRNLTIASWYSRRGRPAPSTYWWVRQTLLSSPSVCESRDQLLRFTNLLPRWDGCHKMVARELNTQTSTLLTQTIKLVPKQISQYFSYAKYDDLNCVWVRLHPKPHPLLLVWYCQTATTGQEKIIAKNPTLGLTSTREDSCQGVGSNHSCHWCGRALARGAGTSPPLLDSSQTLNSLGDTWRARSHRMPPL